jgi:hypothetical protein
MQIREDQQQLEHSVTLVGIALSRLLVQIIHDGKRIGEQPFETYRVDRLAGAAALEGLVGPDECLIEKMVQAELFRAETAGN